MVPMWLRSVQGRGRKLIAGANGLEGGIGSSPGVEMIQAQVLSMPTTLSMLRPFHCSPSKAWRRVLNPISMFPMEVARPRTTAPRHQNINH